MQSGGYQRDRNTLERCRNIWWTIYVLDCHMTALIGTPSTISEQSIGTELPSLGSTQRTQALRMHVRLASTIAMSLSSKSCNAQCRYHLTSPSRVRKIGT